MFTTGFGKLGSARGRGMRALMVQENCSLNKKTTILHSKNLKQAPQSSTAEKLQSTIMEEYSMVSSKKIKHLDQHSTSTQMAHTP